MDIKAYMPRDMSFVSFNFHVFITWGRNENVVKAPAISPKMVIGSIE